MDKLYIGWDNGTTGAIAFINRDTYSVIKTPTKKEFSYTKKSQKVTRIDFNALCLVLSKIDKSNAFILLERPMIFPGRFKATISAVRALEATLIAIEQVKIPFQYCDSRSWQKEFLPHDAKGPDLKAASLQVGMRLYPNIDWGKFDDADSILIARYAQLKGL